MGETIKGYKGFGKGMICRGKQYAENTVFEEEDAEICKAGMHFCTNPFDVLEYYGFVDDNCELNEFAAVEALDDVKTDDDKKFCTRKLKVGAKIGIPGLVKAFVDYTVEKADKERAATNTGDWSAATNTGDKSAATNTGNYSAATNTGDWSAATNTGDYSAATNTGDKSAATNTGDWSAATNTGNKSAATNTGDKSAATNTGNYSAATNTGNKSAATNTGDWSAASVEGEESFAICTGINGKAKGGIGCYIALAEWVERADGYALKDFKTARVDGYNIKDDTFYTLENGEFVEVKEDE